MEKDRTISSPRPLKVDLGSPVSDGFPASPVAPLVKSKKPKSGTVAKVALIAAVLGIVALSLPYVVKLSIPSRAASNFVAAYTSGGRGGGIVAAAPCCIPSNHGWTVVNLNSFSHYQINGGSCERVTALNLELHVENFEVYEQPHVALFSSSSCTEEASFDLYCLPNHT
eukprot:TRINITY_DN267_c0_g1_i1.p1 TRINITY_DN267_c0_g1~~TRINITY_DN267_c0_g1_i1.p1  ORF type:complete len:169 (-),score=17.97 TRINITY_DN267_c0_g1_i1:58-564(-)